MPVPPRVLWLVLAASVIVLVVPTVLGLLTSPGPTWNDGVVYATEAETLSLYPNSTAGPWATFDFRGVSFHLHLVDWLSPAGPAVVGNITEPGGGSSSFTVGGPSSCPCFFTTDRYAGIQYNSDFGVLLMVQAGAPYLAPWEPAAVFALGLVGVVISSALLLRMRRGRRQAAAPQSDEGPVGPAPPE